jgi:hypothetical protein
MSWWSHTFRRLEHFAKRESRRELKFTQRHFLDPSGLLLSGKQQTGIWNDIVHAHEHFAKRSLFYTVREAPYVTAVAALIVNIIPVFGQIISLIIVAVSTIVERYAAELNARVNLGMTGHEARQYARKMEHRNLIYGSVAAAIGGIASAVASVATSAAATGEAAATGAEGAGAAGESAAPSTLELANPSEFYSGIGADATNTAEHFGTSALTNWEGNPGVFIHNGMIEGGGSLAQGGRGLVGWVWDTLTTNPLATLAGLASIGGGVAAHLLNPSARAQLQGGLGDLGLLFGSGGGGSGGGPGISDPGGGFGYDQAPPAGPSLVDYIPWIAIGAVGILILVLLFLR